LGFHGYFVYYLVVFTGENPPVTTQSEMPGRNLQLILKKKLKPGIDADA
jgi:hypothetical protein